MTGVRGASRRLAASLAIFYAPLLSLSSLCAIMITRIAAEIYFRRQSNASPVIRRFFISRHRSWKMFKNKIKDLVFLSDIYSVGVKLLGRPGRFQTSRWKRQFSTCPISCRDIHHLWLLVSCIFYKHRWTLYERNERASEKSREIHVVPGMRQTGTVSFRWFRHFYTRRLPERSGRPSSSRR